MRTSKAFGAVYSCGIGLPEPHYAADLKFVKKNLDFEMSKLWIRLLKPLQDTSQNYERSRVFQNFQGQDIKSKQF